MEVSECIVFEKDDLDYPDISILITVLPLFFNQKSCLDENKTNFYDTQKNLGILNKKFMVWQLDGKN